MSGKKSKWTKISTDFPMCVCVCVQTNMEIPKRLSEVSPDEAWFLLTLLIKHTNKHMGMDTRVYVTITKRKHLIGRTVK